MNAPAVQRFFETPLIEARVGVTDEAAVAAAALALAERHTHDVSQPAQPRFAWSTDYSETLIAPGEAQQLAASPGAFWVALCLIDDGVAAVTIEDPRHALVAGDPSGLRHGSEPLVERVAVQSGGLVMMQGFVRHGLRNDGARPQRWAVVRLRPKRRHP